MPPMANDRTQRADRALVIVNPAAGGGLGEKKSARLIRRVAEGLGEMEVRFTERSGHATILAREAALAGHPLVVAFGGDGTVSEVAGGLLQAREAGADGTTELGIIPRGTGGDFRRMLELPSDPGAAARHIRERPAHTVDAGRVTFTTADGNTATRHFVNVASFGFSSAAASLANRASKAFGGKLAYLSATVRTLIAYQNTEVWLEADGGQPQRRTVMLTAVGNGRFFGGGMKICPEAKLDSGRFHLVTVGDFGKLEVLRHISRLYSGTHLALDDVHAATVRTLRASPVEPGADIPVELDGETPGRLPATFEILPGALRIRF
jgi:YegS/Rv2252/BmrU family lipid kinase